ncbi:MAG: hypothetical protein IJ649_01105 [Oscillospiraceae bacterium]|nr:hypothetical protein [Oscillospiraceae bacterium]
MRFTERLTRLKEWTTAELCKGRVMKAPAPGMNIGKIVTQEPKCFLAWAPARLDQSGQPRADPYSIVPSILIMPNTAYAKYMEEKRFDRYNNVHRPSNMGQHLAVSILFSVYEPGVRLPGFVDSVGENGQGLDMELMREGTEQGLFTLMNWMDDCMQKLLSQQTIPKTDLWVEEATMTYGLYTDQSYVVDRRPIYYGFVNTSFGCYADEGGHSSIDDMLK